MGNIYAGMSVGMGFILFCIVLSFIWVIFKNYTRGVTAGKSADQLDFYGFQVCGNRGEQRKNRNRAEVAWPVFIKTHNGIVRAVIRDINRSGAFIKCDSPCKPGERFRILIRCTEKRRILLNAEVVWSNTGIPEERVVNRGMGIRFTKNPDKDLTALKLAIGQYTLTEKVITAPQAASL
jgi:hypothetical protein